MKNFKHIAMSLTFIFAVFFSWNTNAQKKAMTQTTEGRISIEIPKDLQANGDGGGELITTQEYSEALGGLVEVVGTAEGGLVSITIPEQAEPWVNDGCPDGYRACARGCNDKPTIPGMLACKAYCIIDCNGW